MARQFLISTRPLHIKYGLLIVFSISDWSVEDPTRMFLSGYSNFITGLIWQSYSTSESIDLLTMAVVVTIVIILLAALVTGGFALALSVVFLVLYSLEGYEFGIGLRKHLLRLVSIRQMLNPEVENKAAAAPPGWRRGEQSEAAERNESIEMKVLIAYDGSDFADAILDDLRYAGLPPSAEVLVITIAEPEYILVGKNAEGVAGWLSYRLIEARSLAKSARDRIRRDFTGWNVTFEARIAHPPQEIIRKVVEWNPDLVIIGQDGSSGSKRSGRGRVNKRLFKEANCSVRIARALNRPHNTTPRVVIPIAATQDPIGLAQVITSRIWPPRTEVKLIASIGPILSEMQIVYGFMDAQEGAVMKIQRQVAKELQSANLLVSTEVTADFPATGVIEIARRWRADCVFVWAEEMNFFEKMICGDFVASVAARAECSVEVVRDPVRRYAANSKFTSGAHHEDLLPVVS